jgi:hypothetical protein
MRCIAVLSRSYWMEYNAVSLGCRVADSESDDLELHP